jgi:hypothetical protein
MASAAGMARQEWTATTSAKAAATTDFGDSGLAAAVCASSPVLWDL